MHEPSTHPSLIERLGDPADGDAWREFESRYGDLLVRYARRRGLQAADAEDVRQMVLQSLARSLPGFRYRPELGRFRDYLGRAARNAAFRVIGRPSGRAAALSDDELNALPDERADDPDELWEREWMEHHLRRALRVLRRSFDPTSMEIFDQLLAGSTAAEVAGSFGTSAQAVHKVKQRVRLRLRELLASQLADEETVA